MSSLLMRSSSRPTTPYRAGAKTSLGAQSPKVHYNIDGSVPLNEEQFEELADCFGVLDENLIQVNLINESLVKFNESFSSLLYGLLTNAYCTEFSEAPTSENFSETYLDLDSQINRLKAEIEELNHLRATELLQEKERIAATLVEEPKVKAFKRPLTNATLSRLAQSNKKTSHLVKPSMNLDISYMTNDSFVEEPAPKLKRKNMFGTGGSSANSSSSKIPVRKSVGANKPAWK